MIFILFDDHYETPENGMQYIPFLRHLLMLRGILRYIYIYIIYEMLIIYKMFNYIYI